MSATTSPRCARLRCTALVGLMGSLLGGAGAAASAQAPAPPAGGGRVIVVRALDGSSYGMRFEPLRVTVQPGDTVRFVQAGGLPHNVEVKSMPAGTALGATRVGPLLTTRGATYDLVIDQRFAPGKHLYVCTPHEALGMAGLLYVTDPSKQPGTKQ